MYRRFLNDSDYLGVITAEALAQITRGNTDRFVQAEQSAEMSLVEYLSENYEIEAELNKGKYIAEHDRRITFPVVSFNEAFYTLMTLEGFDNNIAPMTSACWGAIADYDSTYNDYELESHEYVVYEGKVFYPGMDVNADVPIVGHNITLNDPRNFNLKKHLVRLAIYELTKLIAPNNVGSVRMKDYEDSMKWLNDASKLRLNPQIPRKLADDNKPVTDWQLSTFQTNYDPYKNPWLT